MLPLGRLNTLRWDRGLYFNRFRSEICGVHRSSISSCSICEPYAVHSTLFVVRHERLACR